MDSIITLAGKRILVVEDEYFTAVEFCSGLREMGLDPLPPAANVSEALRLIRKVDRADGAVLDINLGGEMVFPVADALEKKSIPFVFVTGYERTILPYRHAGRPLLRKPLNNADLAVALLGGLNQDAVLTPELTGNAILRALPLAQLARLAPNFHIGTFPRGTVLERHKVKQVHFPLDSVIAMTAVGRAGARVDVGMVGREGMTGFDIAGGERSISYELVIEIPGACLSLSVDDFQCALAAMPEFMVLTSRFARSMTTQLAYTAFAYAKLNVRSRLARWLLMLHDRAPYMTLEITHEHLAVMIGVRRSSVTEALHVLEGDHLIRSSRNALEILDRKGLIALAGEAYGVPEDELARSMSLPLDHSHVGRSTAPSPTTSET